MNVLFVGYRKWAYQICKNLILYKSKNWKITAIITTDAKEADFSKLSLPVTVLNDSKKLTIKIIKKYKPRVLLFYGWSWLIPSEIYESYPCLILHTSPLPKYRGGSPIQHQIIAVETYSAATIFQADGGIDTGNIYSQTRFSLSGLLDGIFKQLVKVGIRDTIKVLDGIANHTLFPKPQDHTKATTFKRRKPHDSELTVNDFQTKTAKQLYDFIRALGDPYPNAYIQCKDGKLFFTGARLEK